MKTKDVGKLIASGAIFAFAAGYVAGILTAPKSGKETRKDLKKFSNKAILEAEARLKDYYADLTKLLGKAIDKAKVATGKGREKLDELVDNGKDAQAKIKDVLTAIKRGDAEDPDLKAAVKQASEAKKNLVNYFKKNQTT